MKNIEILKNICEIDEKELDSNYKELIENFEILEKAHSKIQNLVINTKMKQIMNNFGERETDIYITSFPRSGTTLMQMILYQLTTDGNIEFGHIYDVSPWCRYSAINNHDMASVGDRRIIKTHDEYNFLQHIKKGKFIFLIRDCLDTIASIHQQAMDYINPSIDFNELCSRNMKKWFHYNLEWINNSKELKILYINYEDLIANKENMILKISEFLDIKINSQIIERTLQRTSFEFMKKNENKFGEQPESGKIFNNFIRNGRVGEGKNKFIEKQLIDYINLAKEYKIENLHLKRYFVKI